MTSPASTRSLTVNRQTRSTVSARSIVLGTPVPHDDHRAALEVRLLLMQERKAALEEALAMTQRDMDALRAELNVLAPYSDGSR